MIDDKVVDSPRSNDFPNLGMITRNAVHRIRMFLVFICNDYRSSKFTNESPNLRKKSELLYCNDDKLMFVSYSKIVLMALASLPSGSEK